MSKVHEMPAAYQDALLTLTVPLSALPVEFGENGYVLIADNVETGERRFDFSGRGAGIRNALVGHEFEYEGAPYRFVGLFFGWVTGSEELVHLELQSSLPCTQWEGCVAHTVVHPHPVYGSDEDRFVEVDSHWGDVIPLTERKTPVGDPVFAWSWRVERDGSVTHSAMFRLDEEGLGSGARGLLASEMEFAARQIRSLPAPKRLKR